MISEFQDLSDKIDRLAAMTQSLRGENALLRQANTALLAENDAVKWLLQRAQTRLETLLATLPPDDGSAPAASHADQASAAQPDKAAQ